MSVRVVARIRPLLGKEAEKETIVQAESSQGGKPYNIVRIPNPKKESEKFSFSFNAVYDMGTTQDELFSNEVAPYIKSLFRGIDVTIFAYGVTGTGKTHTMRGGMKLSDRGVIPRLLSAIYRRGKKVKKDSNGETSVEVTLSYYEIYNDKVYDLFQAPDKRSLAGLPLREKDGKTVVVGLSEHACNDLKDFERLYIEANTNRSTAGTKLNSQSSRSHAILQVKVSQITGIQKLESTASAIDLAGSEDNRRTENNKERMVESASINKSLFVLSSCIDAIGRGDKRIPYRESRMTRILSLGQNQGITVMILNLAPLRSYHLDTLSSLNVSSRAKRIEVREIENEIVFTRPPAKTATLTGNSMARQPLRSLKNAHNTHPSAEGQKADKPIKSFSVYTDKSRTSFRTPAVGNQTNLKSCLSQKRPADLSQKARPTKSIKLNLSGGKNGTEISSEKIEKIIEQKVQEALAIRAHDQTVVQTIPDISESVQRRLEALERRIDSGEAEESRAEGLRFLLMAKQHKARGEDSSALKMYELATPFFPGQEKLQRKIDVLRAKIQAKKNDSIEIRHRSSSVTELNKVIVATSPIQLPSLSTAKLLQEPSDKSIFTLKSPGRDTSRVIPHDFLLEKDHSSESLPTKCKGKNLKVKVTTKSPLGILSNDDIESLPSTTPRTRHLLDIINSRDLNLIKGLHGVGTKKARDLVEHLELQSEEDGGNIRSLQELFAVPGLGKKSIERAYEGISALLM